MIHITRGAINYIYTTLKEKQTNTTGVYYLFECENILTKEKKYFLPTSVDVTTDRYEKIKLQETDSEILTGGKVKLKPSGTWKYTVYEQTSSSNLVPTAESVVGVIETGILQVSNATEEVTYNFHTTTETNYIHIP